MALSSEVKFFTSAMVGAPVLSGAAGAYIGVLDACLVNGFGLKPVDSVVVSNGVATATISTGHSAVRFAVVEIAGAGVAAINGQHRVTAVGVNTVQWDATGVPDGPVSGSITLKLAAAGWTKAFAGTNLAAYKSANPQASGYHFRVDDTANLTARVQGFATMSDVNTGVGGFNNNYNYKAHNTTGSRGWFVIANDKFVYIGVRVQDGYAGFTIAGFGDIKSRKPADAHRAFVHCNSLNTTISYAGADNISYARNATIDSRAMLARNFTGFGAGVDTYITLMLPNFTSSIATLSGNGGYPYPNGPDFGLLLMPLYLRESGTNALRGELPGVMFTPQAMANQIATTNEITQFIEDSPDLPGRVLAAVPVLDAATAGTRYPTFIDIIGPWGN